MNVNQHLVSHFPYLAAVYRHQSFTQAAASLFVSQTAVSYQIKRLEEKLDCRLVIRQSGSRLRFTADGETLAKTYLLCEKQLAAAIESLNHKQGHGTLRLSTPIDLGSMVMPSVIAQLRRHIPNLKIEMHSSDKPVNLDQSPWDMAIRSQLTPTKSALYCSPIMLVAGAKYMKSHKPGTLSELATFTILMRQNSNNSSWQKLLGHPPAFPSVLTLGTTLGMSEAARENLGIALLPEFVVRRELSNGQLVQLLPKLTKKLTVYFDLLKIDSQQTTSYESCLRDAFAGLTQNK